MIVEKNPELICSAIYALGLNPPGLVDTGSGTGLFSYTLTS
jgi:hypothetical protein